MEATQIDMTGYVKSGEGANGSSYDKIGDPGVMVKMYNPDYDRNAIVSEVEIARKVYGIGVKSPEPGELVTDGERLGIRFRRIEGKRSYSRMLADEPERVDELSREFARNCKALHSVKCPEGMFPDAKQQFLDLLAADREFTAEQQAVMAGFIRSVPEADTAVHGDMHIGNAISTLPSGAALDTPHDIYFIDLGYFAKGCPLFDMGMLMNVCLIADEEFRFHDLHIHADLARKVWESFVDEYFFADDRLGEKWFGKGATPETVFEGLKPYCAVKMLLVEYNLGFMPPHYAAFIRETFGF